MTDISKYEAILALVREAFPDETIRDGHRMTQKQVGLLNKAVFDIKAMEAAQERADRAEQAEAEFRLTTLGLI